MQSKTQCRHIISALALGGLLATAASPPMARADAADTISAATIGGSNTTAYAQDGGSGKGKGKKGDKGGTEPIIIGEPIIVHDPPKAPPKKDK